MHCHILFDCTVQQAQVQTEENDMSEKRVPQVRLPLIMLVLLWEIIHLGWEQFHGGVRSYHFLAMEEMPVISNWWELLPVRPRLVRCGSNSKRMDTASEGKDAKSTMPVGTIVGFIVPLVFGLLLSFSSTNGYDDITSYLFFGMFALALLLPIHRGECLLGFVLGMTFTFGAILPMLIGSILAALSALVHLLVVPSLVRLWKWLRRGS